ncbi:hypothetical protein GA549_07290 [Bifidobacterium adolescentis]|uniref:Uncharacterized protein n=1 Tax=Bifidobacterium adolescentis TaxID=1680 RepID=A0A6I0V917_BIFAD|nr:hypothetical protein GA578_09095 [Bifidobacterium adolescentis]KAB5972852.1 hypothetical protein GA577_07240 [Bifidobacterium adolescentis]KAB5974454.1 hypothetical protein GA576_07270 [Bifidobacterium adolescentis]KAB5976654.1 hypothetical protein GA569_03700 [Bifidobacterium adolescentis]KAB5978909.1 hypothetical protein GA573_06525 [Bifidobacterium adolescentis]
MDDIDQTMVIDSARVGRMASSRTDGRSTTMYGRHRKGAGRPRKARPERPVEPFMAALMTAFAALWLAGMLATVWFMPMSAPAPWTREAVSAVCVHGAVVSTFPAWTYLARYGRERRHGL